MMTVEAPTSRTVSRGRRLGTAAALFVLLQTPNAAVESPSNVTVHEERGVYTVSARFQVEEFPPAAMTVLTDYEQIPRFMPDVRTSIVRERSAGRAVVEQEAVSRMLLFSKRVHLVLEIDEQAEVLTFRDRCRQHFKRYEGAWRMSRQGGHTAISYELIAEPSFEVPGFLLKRLLRRDSGEMIERLQKEIATRAKLVRQDL